MTVCLLLLGSEETRASDDRLISRFFADHTAILLLIDPYDGQILDGNRQAERFYGINLPELQGMQIDDINAHPPSAVAEQRALAVERQRDFFVFPHRTRHQGVRSVAVYSSPVELPSGRSALLSIIHDVTDHLIPEEDSEAYRISLERLINRASQDLIDQRERHIFLQRWFLAGLAAVITVLGFALWGRRQALSVMQRSSFEARKLQIAVDQSPASIVITDREGIIEYANRTCIANTGYTREELIGQNPRMLQSGRMPKEMYVDLWAKITAGRTWQGRLVNRRKDGSEYVEWALINPVLDENDQPIRFIAVKEDITEREQLEQRLQSLEHYDALTGLANRYAFLGALEQRLEQILPQLSRQPMALVNVDRFHAFNATHGHEAADRLLQLVARRLVEHAPEQTLVARIGPDEFAVLPPLEPIRDVQSMGQKELQWIQRIQRALREGWLIDGQSRQASASIGVAFCDQSCQPEDHCRPGDFMRMADSALHAAKTRGGGQLAFFDAEASVQVQEALRLEEDLVEAIERGELHLAIQSQVWPDGRLVGAEVLLRWRHGRLGDISPGRFIPLAEDSGQIVPIGFWVLEQAVGVLESLQAHDPALTLSVNISPMQIRRPDFVAGIEKLFGQSQAQPSGLVLEITESVFMEEPELARTRLQALRELGVGISIDDFGTGYSSLTYLKRLPVTELKIDQSFIAGLPHDEADAALVNIILSAADQLELRVVAEGVETAEQATYFDRRSNVVLQGYFYNHPVPVVDWIDQWLKPG